MADERWGPHQRGRVSHAWRQLPNGRWESVCGTHPERWSEPYSQRDGSHECGLCDFRLNSEPRVHDLMRRAIGVRWPRALTFSQLQRRDTGTLNRAVLKRVLLQLEAEGQIQSFEVPGKTGRKRYAARRALVEALGRRYGI